MNTLTAWLSKPITPLTRVVPLVLVASALLLAVGCSRSDTGNPDRVVHLIQPGFYDLMRSVPDRKHEDPKILDTTRASIVRGEIKNVSCPSVVLFDGVRHRFDCTLVDPSGLHFRFCPFLLDSSDSPEVRTLTIRLVKEESIVATRTIEARMDARDKADWQTVTYPLRGLKPGDYGVEFELSGGARSGDPGRNGVVFIGAPVMFDRTSAPRKPNILFIVLDALRADFLGSGGDSAPISPFMDYLARTHIQWTPLVSFSSFTRLSMNAMFTGRFRHTQESFNKRSLSLKKYNNRAAILPARLYHSGYRTIGVSGNILVDPENEYDYGFDWFDTFPCQYYHPGTFDVNNGCIERAITAAPDLPWFVYLHCIDPHDPYSPPEPYERLHLDVPPALFRDPVEGRNGYRGEIRRVDHMLEELFRRLADLGQLDNTVCVITADHGESFGEHGTLTHGKNLYEEVLRVPMICVNGAQPTGQLKHYNGTSVDVYRLFENLAGLDIMPLTDVCDPIEASAPHDRILHSRLHHFKDVDPWQVALTQGNLKAIRTGGSKAQCFNLDTDPQERSPFESCGLDAELDGLVELYAPTDRDIQSQELMPFDPRESEKLRELGYLQ